MLLSTHVIGTVFPVCRIYFYIPTTAIITSPMTELHVLKMVLIVIHPPMNAMFEFGSDRGKFGVSTISL